MLAFNSHESMYVTLVEALCDEQQINLIKVHDSEELGPGQASVKLTEGKPCGVVGCSCGSKGQR